jgi:hypothetical protein
MQHAFAIRRHARLMNDAGLTDGQNLAQSAVGELRDLQRVFFAIPLHEGHMRHTSAIRRESRKIAPFALRLPNSRFGQQILREGRNGEEREKGWSEHGGL